MNREQTRQDCSGDTTLIRCPVSGPSPEQNQGICGFVRYLISCCPYTMVGKKILQFLRGETGIAQEPVTNRELHLKSQIKIGLGIMLIGIFCPIFWISFLSGARGNELMFNAIHSGIVILFGLLYFATYRIQLINEQAQRSRKGQTSKEIS
jgi:hypothetical protein